MPSPELESAFPGLSGSDYEITSQATPSYNCIAWAAGEDFRWWEPDPFRLYFWPDDVPRNPDIDSYLRAFVNMGYELCQDDTLEAGFQKVAIYQGLNGQPSHMARQRQDGSWTSKLGSDVDIVHESLAHLEGLVYGKAFCFLRRLLAR